MTEALLEYYVDHYKQLQATPVPAHYATGRPLYKIPESIHYELKLEGLEYGISLSREDYETIAERVKTQSQIVTLKNQKAFCTLYVIETSPKISDTLKLSQRSLENWNDQDTRNWKITAVKTHSTYYGTLLQIMQSVKEEFNLQDAIWKKSPSSPEAWLQLCLKSGKPLYSMYVSFTKCPRITSATKVFE